VTTEELHKLGDVLRAAREAKGVDLPRVERDTKIRSRYLSALEHGDYEELPGPVYTKGFLRNYGTYLGLDPEYLTDLYRLETNGSGAERSVPVPPRPMTVRRSRALVVTPGAIAAAILTIGVLAFAAYLTYEFVTFARTPDLRITEPSGDVARWHGTSYTITGVTEPNSRITVDGLRENPSVTADSSGRFSVTVQLVPGSNVITLTASDPLTQRDSAKVSRTINVDMGSASPTPTSVVAISQPAAGAAISGLARVAGTAGAGTKVVITARLVSAMAPGFTVSNLAGQRVPIPALTPGAKVTGTATATATGDFSTTLALAPGSWDLGIAPGGVTRRVTVKPSTSLAGTLRVGARSYILLLQDGVPLAGVSGTELTSKSVAVAAHRAIVIRAGNAAAVIISINGVTFPAMGRAGEVIEWHINIGST
jgi:cytoskeletal protein RodZ